MESIHTLAPILYAISFLRNDITYGTALILAREPIGNDDISIIETISNQVSLSLHRKAIERDLKESEDRYRRLNRELELKVKERTHDLESTNYLLNQELIEHHRAEEALKKSEANLMELNATKDKFFNIIAHDLKNPFTCLLGSTEILNEKLDNMDRDNIRNLVQVINDSARSGFSILQNLLVWSRSQTGLISYSPESFNLKNLIEECISDIKAGYHRKEISIVNNTEGCMDIFADRNMISTILRNLADNAVKFTPGYGVVEITALNNTDEIMLSVRDTGIGIPEKNIADLFRIDKKFTRPGTDKEQGTGLGLKICKEFIDMQGGTIEVKSTVNKGSEFIFTIPLRKD
jgi:signal transduction histidine kinase